VLSFSSIYTSMHALTLLPKLFTLGFGLIPGLLCLAMQSWVSYKSFHPLWCWVWLVSLWEMVSHPSRCDLTVVRIDVVVWARMEWWRRWNSHQVMWFVMLESAKDRILRVDTPGQHVPPRVLYGTTCLLIRYAIGWVSCSVEWGCHHTLWSILLHTLWTA
jgi:hypothetical protein